MPIQKKVLQGVLVLGWLVWSLPAVGAGEHSPHEGKQAEHGSGKHGGHPGSEKKGYSGKHSGHGYGRPKGPPTDIPAHIKERMDSDGTKVNLNRSLIGVK